MNRKIIIVIIGAETGGREEIEAPAWAYEFSHNNAAYVSLAADLRRHYGDKFVTMRVEWDAQRVSFQ